MTWPPPTFLSPLSPLSPKLRPIPRQEEQMEELFGAEEPSFPIEVTTCLQAWDVVYQPDPILLEITYRTP